MEKIYYDFSRICRTCKVDSNEQKSIFETYDLTENSPRIDHMLAFSTSSQVNPEDGLPNQICFACLENLKISYYFKQQCDESYASLREYSKNLKLNLITEELQIQNGVDLFTPGVVSDPVSISVSADSLDAPLEKPSDNNEIILTCGECNKVFTTIDGLKYHQRIHSGVLFKCDKCGKGFTRPSHLARHELSHGKHKVHICKVCNKSISRFDHLKQHLMTHLKEKPYLCGGCNRGFIRPEDMEVHSRRCKGDPVHICDICNRGFARLDSLEVHKKVHVVQTHELPTIDDINNVSEYFYEINFEPNEENSAEEGSGPDELFEVRVKQFNDEEEHEEKIIIQGHDLQEGSCNDFELQSELNRLLDTKIEIDTGEIRDLNYTELLHPNHGSDTSDYEYIPKKAERKKRSRGRPRKSSLQGRPKIAKLTDYKTDEIGDFSCLTCGESFVKKTLLEKHAFEKHNQLKEHICLTCNKKFSRFTHLKRHLMSHASERPFSCDSCGKQFTRNDHLHKHLKLHEQKADFECDICSKCFVKEEQLAKHKIVKHELGEKDFPVDRKFGCTMCNKKFTTAKYRDTHVRGHIEKLFMCKVCNKNFLSKSHLTEHMKFHNEHSKKFLCSECGQRFIRNDYLVIHMRRHRGEKPFKCKFCGKGFPRTTDLTVHERYHTGEKTHLCTICGRGFGRAYNLTVHMRTHTGEKPYQCTYCEAAFAQGNDLKAHVRRHTGERFNCELCSESFLMGYLLTQHKRTVHGLNVVSNIRRLQPMGKLKSESGEEEPITIPLPKPVVPDRVLENIQAHLAAQLHYAKLEEEEEK